MTVLLCKAIPPGGTLPDSIALEPGDKLQLTTETRDEDGARVASFVGNYEVAAAVTIQFGHMEVLSGDLQPLTEVSVARSGASA